MTLLSFREKHHTPKFLKARSAKETQIVDIFNIHLRRVGVLVDVDEGRIGFVDGDTFKLVSEKFAAKNL